jgi:hypothetical protein
MLCPCVATGYHTPYHRGGFVHWLKWPDNGKIEYGRSLDCSCINLFKLVVLISWYASGHTHIVDWVSVVLGTLK